MKKKEKFGLHLGSLSTSAELLEDIESEEEKQQEGAEQHPNAMKFSGVLLLLDEPSDKAPHGAQGHRILVPAAVAKRRLSTIKGMGLNYAPTLDQHAPRRKVGVITEASIVGNALKVKGIIWKKDFPEAEDDLRQGRLGMSMELADVYVRDKNEDVWYLQDFHFTGATALKKSAAAYYHTSLAARGETIHEGSIPMAKKEEKVEAPANLDLTQLGSVFAQALTPVLDQMKAQGETLKKLADVMDGQLAERIAASGEDDDDEDIQATGGKDKGDGKDKGGTEDDGDDDGDEDDMDSEADTGDLEDLEDDEMDKGNSLKDGAEDKPSQRPGKTNEGAKNKGDKTTVSASRSISAANDKIRTLSASVKKLKQRLAASIEENEELSTKVETLEAQMEAYADKVDRRTVTPELATLLEKGNINIHEMAATGAKLTVGQVDTMFANCGITLDPTTRAAMKNQLVSAGLMEQGEVRR